MPQPLPPIQANSNEVSLIFPAFARLTDFLLEHELPAETVGFIIGRATRDLWLGAASEAEKVLGTEEFAKIVELEDLDERFASLVEVYRERTGIDIQERLNQAAEALTNEIIQAGPVPAEII